jgi:hypothetical protein
MERNALGPLLADDCLWGLAPQSSPWPKSAVYPSAAFGEDGESRLPATSGTPEPLLKFKLNRKSAH